MFRKLKLKKYLLGVFSLLLVLTGIITAVGVVGLMSTNRSADTLVNEVLAADTAAKTCRIEVNVAARDLREMLLTDDASRRAELEEEINDSLNSISQQINVFKQTHGEADGMAQKYESAFNTWFAIADRAISQVNSGNIEGARQIVINECSPALDQLVAIAQEIDSVTASSKADQQQGMLQGLWIAIVSVIVVFVAALVFGLLVAIYTIRSIIRAVEAARDAVTELSEGNLHVEMDYTADNEFGELMAHMKSSFEELSKYVDAIHYGMSEFSGGNLTCTCPIQFRGDFAGIQTDIENFQEKLNNTLVEMELAASQVSSGANQVADGAQALAQGATQQASGVEELTSTISEISSGVTDTSDYARQANEMGKQAADVVEKSASELDQLVAAIRDIAEASNNIQSIIKVINDIAFQTNILALNAAVEAARAGTAGKGFAVVADEVRDLAQKTAAAATDTTDLIETSLRHVKKGENLALEAEQAFGEVSRVAQDILVRVDRIATVSQEQADSIAQISLGLDQISAVVQTTSATAEESAAASEELNGQASTMRSLLNQFQLNRP